MTDISSNGLRLEKTRLESDLDVNASDDLKLSGHVNRMVARHHEVFYQLKKPISNISRLSLNLILFHLKY